MPKLLVVCLGLDVAAGWGFQQTKALKLVGAVPQAGALQRAEAFQHA